MELRGLKTKAFGAIAAPGANFFQKILSPILTESGGTSSGKTTFLNALSDFIPSDERVIVIEDSAELQLDGIENIVRMETKNANIQGVGEITMRHLIKASLRMRPDRIIIGEVRGASRIICILYIVSNNCYSPINTIYCSAVARYGQ